jgi:hypothetical protein
VVVESDATKNDAPGPMEQGLFTRRRVW